MILLSATVGLCGALQQFSKYFGLENKIGKDLCSANLALCMPTNVSFLRGKAVLIALLVESLSCAARH